MALALAGVGLFEPDSMAWNLSLSLMGFASGYYVVPLNAWLQDLAAEAHRARIISALNLMTSFSGVVAVGLGFGLDKFGVMPSGQILVMVPVLIVVGVFLVQFLKTDASDSE